MSINARLHRMMPALSAKERFLIETRAMKASEPQDPSIRKTMPSAQIDEFNRYVSLRQAVNNTLAHYITALSLMADKLNLRFLHTHAVGGLALRIWDLATLIPASKQKKAEAFLAKSRRPFDLPWQQQEPGNTWLDEADEMFESMKNDLRTRWQELLAVEAVIADANDQVDGEDLADPSLRERLGHARYVLEVLAELVDEPVPSLDRDSGLYTETLEVFEAARLRFK